jgi:hypothetical protein
MQLRRQLKFDKDYPFFNNTKGVAPRNLMKYSILSSEIHVMWVQWVIIKAGPENYEAWGSAKK